MILTMHQCEACLRKTDEGHDWVRWGQLQTWDGRRMEICSKCLLKILPESMVLGPHA